MLGVEFIPAILYGGKDPNQKISIEKKAIRDIINSDNFLSKVLELDIEGKKEKVLPRDVAYHVVSEEPIHIDFMRVISGKKIVLEIPVKFINHSESPGLKRGGVLNIVRRAVELKCPAESIPNDITIDLKGTDIGTSLKISSVKLAENVTPTITDRDFVIATVAAPTIIKEPEKPAETESADGTTGETAVEGTEVAAKEGEPAKKDESYQQATYHTSVCRVDQKEKRSASTRCASTSSTALASSRMSRHGTTSYVS